MGSNGTGFNFDLCKRNAMLEAKGVSFPKAWKTGTTIAGIVFKVCGPLLSWRPEALRCKAH